MIEAAVLGFVGFLASAMDEVIAIHRQHAITEAKRAPTQANKFRRAGWCAGYAAIVGIAALVIITNPAVGFFAYVTGAGFGGWVAE